MAELNLTNPVAEYGKDAIVTLSPREHIRLRPGMYIGKLGDGTQADDGIYVLLKEVVDNSIDEFIMGAGPQTARSIRYSGCAAAEQRLRRYTPFRGTSLQLWARDNGNAPCRRGKLR